MRRLSRSVAQALARGCSLCSMLRHACQLGAGAKRRRLSGKQPPPPAPTQAVIRGIDLGPEADTRGSITSGREVYLVTLPHPIQVFSSCGIRLVPPGSYTRVGRSAPQGRPDFTHTWVESFSILGSVGVGKLSVPHTDFSDRVCMAGTRASHV